MSDPRTPADPVQPTLDADLRRVEDDRTVRRDASLGEASFGEASFRDASFRDDGVVTLAEEYATITKRRYDKGTVRVSTVTESFDHVERAQLAYETAEVTHHPVNQFVDQMPQVREEGDLTILPVVEERLVVEKRLFVTEEIHIRRVRQTEEVEVPVNLRRQHAVVERLDPTGDGVDQTT